MADSAPLVSIGVPVYNGEAFIRPCLDTLLAQTMTDFEIVVSDNGSTDSTPQLLTEYARRDPRVRIELQERNRGGSWNFNRVLQIADPAARYFKWAAADDEHSPGYLEATVALLEGDPDLSLAHTGTRDIDENGCQLRVWDAQVSGLDDDDPAERIHDLVTKNYECFQAFGLMRGTVARETQGLGRYSDADRILIVEIALRGKLRNAPDVLFSRRQHSNRSMVVFDKARERHAWFAPDLAGRVTFPYWRLGCELHRAIRRAPLSASERRRCERQVAAFAHAHRSYLMRNVARAGIDSARRMTQRATRHVAGHAA